MFVLMILHELNTINTGTILCLCVILLLSKYNNGLRRTNPNTLLGDDRHTIKRVAMVVGKLVAALPGVQYGRLHYRSLEQDKKKRA